MNLKDKVNQKLWDAIKANFVNEKYKESILDAIQLVGDIIREKSGLDSDGNILIGSALGGSNPKIKLNRLNTDTEKNIQKGTEAILRGIYSSIRNPRSHTKIEDSEDEAIEIILLINFVLRRLDDSKGTYSIDLFINQVKDEDFVRTKKYVDIIISKVPSSKRLETSLKLLEEINELPPHNLNLVWNAIFKKLKKEDQNSLLSLISEKLRSESDIGVAKSLVSISEDYWDRIDEDSRLRIENKFLKTISKAEIYANGKYNTQAAIITWVIEILYKKDFSLKQELINELLKNLTSEDEDRVRFSMDLFGDYLTQEAKEEKLLPAIKKGLKNGSRTIKDYLDNPLHPLNSKLKKDLSEFTPTLEVEDLPF